MNTLPAHDASRRADPAQPALRSGFAMPAMASHEFFLRLFPYQPISVRCGVDRFGFANLLARRLGIRRAPRAFANWQHGWIWWGAESAEELMFDTRIADKPHLVSHVSEREVLLREGFSDVRVAGLPFAYTEKTVVRRTPGSLLVMPPHSSEADKLAKSSGDYLDYLSSIRQDFERVAVCVFHNDFMPALAKDLERRGLQYVIGARPDDANSMGRMRAIFDGFEFVTTNTMGSHVAYSLFAGCKTTIAGPPYPYCERDFGSVRAESDSGYLGRLLHYLSDEYMRKNFGFLLADHPREGLQDSDFGSTAIGAHYRLDGASIRQALSWGRVPQLAGYAQAIQNRTSRHFGALVKAQPAQQVPGSLGRTAVVPLSQRPVTESALAAKLELPRDRLCEFFLDLHPYSRINIRSGVDRFGFAHVLARRLGVARVPRSFANWLHGWIWWGGDAPEDMHFDAHIRDKTHVVSHWSQRETLTASGFTDVRVGGLPFAYTAPSVIHRSEHALLVMLPHSSESTKLTSSNALYLNYLASLRDRFERIAVCVFYLDATPEVRHEIERRGLEFIVGARPDDANAMPRMRAIFDSFGFMTTNTLGSHVAYAMFAGCKVSIAGPLYHYDARDFESLRKRSGSAYVERLLHYYSHDYLRDQFGFLSVGSPADAVLRLELGGEAVGAENTLRGQEALDTLSWRGVPQVVGYARASRNRLERAIKAQF